MSSADNRAADVADSNSNSNSVSVNITITFSSSSSSSWHWEEMETNTPRSLIMVHMIYHHHTNYEIGRSHQLITPCLYVWKLRNPSVRRSKNYWNC